MITHLTKARGAFSSKSLPTFTSVSDFREQLCSRYPNVSFPWSICSVSAWTMVSSIWKQSWQEEGRNRQPHSSWMGRRGTEMAPTWNCRDQLLNVLQNKMMILRYNYLKFKYAYRIVQLLQSIKCKRSCSSHFYYLGTVDKCAIERFYRCANSS